MQDLRSKSSSACAQKIALLVSKTGSIALFLFILFFGSRFSYAGGGPENVFLVVNVEHDSSKLIANHYASWREIPSSNILYLRGIPNKEILGITQFRKRILAPILGAIRKRKLTEQIDCIVYSDGFPTTISLWADSTRDKSRKYPKHFKGQGSINSLTYFAEQVMQEQFEYWKLNSNRYMRVPLPFVFSNPFVGKTQVELVSAEKSYQKGDFDLAVKGYKKIIRQEPDQALTYLLLARGLARLGKAEQALIALETSVKKGWPMSEVLERDSALGKLRKNPRFFIAKQRIPENIDGHLPTVEFRHSDRWATNGLLNTTKANGQRYYLSTVLATTRDRGNSVKEVLAYLRKSVDVEATRPKGIFYFSKTSDIRTKVRVPQIPFAKKALEHEGYKIKIIDSWAPENRNDILGLTFGIARHDWSKTGSSILPGAICDRLTSAGGVIRKCPQTPLTLDLARGASGSSGTVIEPFAIPAKFPHALIHAHYVRGASLAEAYYQSVYAPYQLLIVGDALCQPWAKKIEFDLTGIQSGDHVTSRRTISLTEQEKLASTVSHWRVYLDGRLQKILKADENYVLSPAALAAGYHELRAVVIDTRAVASQTRKILSFTVSKQVGSLTLKRIGTLGLTLESKIRVHAQASVKVPIHVLHHQRLLGVIKPPQSTLILNAIDLGEGPVTLRAKATIRGQRVLSPPLQFQIDSPELE